MVLYYDTILTLYNVRVSINRIWSAKNKRGGQSLYRDGADSLASKGFSADDKDFCHAFKAGHNRA